MLDFKISYDLGPVAAWFELDFCIDLIPKIEEAGFDVAWMGDHLIPWFHTHAHSPQAWVLLTIMAERTRKIPIGSDVTVPMFKYHPVIVAHAFGTMGRLYPGRVLLGVGSGEAINEAPFVDRWPRWKERAEMLIEAIELMRKFWTAEDYFDFEGKYFKIKGLYCYDKPKKPMPIYFSALGPKAAYLAGKHGDHLMTAGPLSHLRDVVFPRFEEGAKDAGKDTTKMEKVVYLDGGLGDIGKLVAKYRKTSASSLLPESFDERDPRKLEKIGSKVPDEVIKANACLFSSANEFIELISGLKNIGATHFILGDWGYDPEGTIKAFKEEVIPYLK